MTTSSFTQRLVPVVVLRDVSRAAELGQALCAGGLPVAEITFRTPGAVEGLATMARNSNLLVGAGTVTTPDQVDQARDAGARFIVSPGLDERIVERSLNLGLPVFPGVVTPSEIMRAVTLGLTTLKFFPASTFGGTGALRAFASPFSTVRFVPTGGINAKNVAEYLALPNVEAVGGSWMVPSDLVDAGEFGAIESLCQEAVAAAAAHVETQQ